MEKERNVDCMKYRKSTHLAGVDVEMIISELGSCVLTIKDAYYEKGVDVSGNKTDGYFLEFEEPYKGMVANSINRATITKIVKREKQCSNADARLVSNWVGTRIELYFEESVKMMGKVTGGIRIKEFSQLTQKEPIDTTNALSILNACETLKELQDAYVSLSVDEKSEATVIALKDELKTKLK